MVVTTDPPTFDRRDAGTAEGQWRASGFADGAAPLDLAGVRRLIVVSAHPDDESLGAAGLISRLNTLGARVLVIVASDGEASHPDSTVHSRAARRTPTLLVDFAGHDSGEVYRFLATRGVNVPASSFYALEASRALGLGDAGALRVGVASYTDDSDVDRLLDGLEAYFAQA